ncbi:amidohydrolase [Klebsiella pneumoniae]|uniref:amidohydrolase n=1 Tax=Klebsiella pneumoniae TaxID=573 RepID=UPI000CEA71ED|nr:amidohydrolase [Klebsiella pneumoniae]SPE95069.1 Indole-3-acetyl-aspartic acid hydrolase [Klebsiella pneumoniae]
MPQLDEYLRQLAPSMTQWRRDFHLHAESGWLEFRTASKVADILDGLGYQLALGRDVIDADSRMGLPDEETLARAFERAREQGAPERWLPAFEGGFAGVVATLDTGRPGPTLAFRVDMDALDLNEQHDDSHRPHRDHFASCNAGMMHACGHDGHTAIGLGLAHVLKQYAAQLNGVIKLIFQPAEEGTRGARAMVAAAQAALGLHAIPPHSAGASRVNVGVMQAGTGRNVVPSSALLKVETRGESEAINQYVFERAQHVVAGAAAMYEARYELRMMGAATASAPSPAWVDYLREQAARVPGVQQAVDRIAAPAGSEDATLMMARVQARGGLASYMIFGTELSAGHHNEKFDFDESVMAVAVETLARVALNFPWQRGG